MSVRAGDLLAGDLARLPGQNRVQNAAQPASPIAQEDRELRSLLGSLKRLSLQRTRQVDAQAVSTSRFFQTVSAANRPLVDSENRFEGVLGRQRADKVIDRRDPGQWAVPIGSEQRAAESAAVRILGDGNGTSAVRGEIRIFGPAGAVDLKMGQGESLVDIAARINARSDESRVFATANGSELRLESVAMGAANTVRVEAIKAEMREVVANRSQVAGVHIDSHALGETETLTGNVTAATPGELVYHGRTGGLAAGSATFRVSGPIGAVELEMADGEALADVATRINQHREATGVVAEADGEDLRMSTAATGSEAAVQVQLLRGPVAAEVSGANPAEVSRFEVGRVEKGAPVTVFGVVQSMATSATLSLEGDAGSIIDNANFDLTGHRGSAELSVRAGESLWAAAERINEAAAETGVNASVLGNQLVFTDLSVGSSSMLEIAVRSGARRFEITGGDGQGRARGTDAEAEFDGVVLTGQGNRFLVRDDRSEFSIEFAPGFLGIMDPITIESGTASFDLSGGDSSGRAFGNDAFATINGDTYLPVGDEFVLTTSAGKYRLKFAEGYSGDLDPIETRSTPATIDIEEVHGGDGWGEGLVRNEGQEGVLSADRWQTAAMAGAGPSSGLAALDSQISTITARIRELQTSSRSPQSTRQLETYRRAVAQEYVQLAASGFERA